jgi:hypothetical protein
MSSKRVRLIFLTGIILIALIIGTSVLINAFLQDTHQIPLPETSAYASESDGTGAAASNGLKHVLITTDNVQTVIATMKRQTSYSRHVKVESVNTTGSAVYEINSSVYNDTAALKVSNAGINENILVTPDTLYIWYDGDKSPYERPINSFGDEKNTSDEYQKMMSYEDVLKIDKSSIKAADYMEHYDENCIYVQYADEPLGYITDCYISVDSGLLIGAEQYDGNTLIYRMTTSDYKPGAPDLSVFTLPNGRNPVSAP